MILQKQFILFANGAGFFQHKVGGEEHHRADFSTFMRTNGYATHVGDTLVTVHITPLTPLQQFVVHGKTFNQVFSQNLSCQNTELHTTVRIYTVTDTDYHVKIIVSNLIFFIVCCSCCKKCNN